MKRKVYDKKTKNAVLSDIEKGDETLTTIAKKYSMPLTTVSKWSMALNGKKRASGDKTDYKSQCAVLRAEIDRLKIQLKRALNL